MKVIHCADIHLGSKLTSKFPDNITKKRRAELRSTFSRMIDSANSSGVKVIILSGDVFDRNDPFIKDKDFFYNAVKRNPDIDFLYLRGNHDNENFYTLNDISNLKTFSKDEFTSYEYGNVVISGIEIDQSNAQSFYSMLELDKSKLNIVMLHGDVSDSMGVDKIKISELRGRGIDYLALGHIHTHAVGKIDERGKWAFPGCLEGRGFDECGEKGYIMLDISDKITPEFRDFSERTIHEISFDASGYSSIYDIQQKLKEQTSSIPDKDIVRVVLSGEVNDDTEIDDNDIISALSRFCFVDVKNKMSVTFDPNYYKDDKSLIGEFVRGVYSNPDYDDSERAKLAVLGLKVLNGREVD